MLHALDVGANYWSLWTEAGNVAAYRERRPAAFEALERRLGYRVRPSSVWQRKRASTDELVVAFANDGAASVPGVLRVFAETRDGKALAGGGLDAGHPFAGRLRLASFLLPPGMGGSEVRPAGRARGEGRPSAHTLGLRAAARRGRRTRRASQDARRVRLAEGDMNKSKKTGQSFTGGLGGAQHPPAQGRRPCFVDPRGSQLRSHWQRCLLSAALGLVAPLIAAPLHAAEAPTPEMFRVLEPHAEGPRITPYLSYQIERAWAFDAARQERFARVKTEADLRALQDELRQKVLRVIGGLPETKTPLNASVTGRIQMNGYHVDKLTFESLPGIDVTALVYMPEGLRP